MYAGRESVAEQRIRALPSPLGSRTSAGARVGAEGAGKLAFWARNLVDDDRRLLNGD